MLRRQKKAQPSRRSGCALILCPRAAACVSDGQPSTGALQFVEARNRLATICSTTTTRLDGLADPIDEAQRPAWTREVAAILSVEALAVRNLVLLDAEQRAGFRSFASNTDTQADRWLKVATILDASSDLTNGVQLDKLTVAITELSLARDDLVDVLGVTECLRR